MSIIRMLLFIAVAFLLSACAEMHKVKDKVDGLLQPSTAEQKLSSGVKSYEEGDYKSSLEALRDAEKMGLSRKDDQISAHKYSAFIYCITEHKNKCRHEFEDVLELDPNFDLQPAEAGHPVWGPVFRGVKADFAK
jgi:Tfp pilus assembly protein PilF